MKGIYIFFKSCAQMHMDELCKSLESSLITTIFISGEQFFPKKVRPLLNNLRSSMLNHLFKMKKNNFEEISPQIFQKIFPQTLMNARKARPRVRTTPNAPTPSALSLAPASLVLPKPPTADARKFRRKKTRNVSDRSTLSVV